MSLYTIKQHWFWYFFSSRRESAVYIDNGRILCMMTDLGPFFRSTLGLTSTATDHACSFLFFVFLVLPIKLIDLNLTFFSWMWCVLCSCPAIIFTQSSKLLGPRVLSQHYLALSWMHDFQYNFYSAPSIVRLKNKTAIYYARLSVVASFYAEMNSWYF